MRPLLVLVWALIFTPLFQTFSIPFAQAQDMCKTELAEAEQKYQEGSLDEAIALVTRCLEKNGLAIAESERAHKLLGKAYYAKGLLDKARENLRKLLELIPNWKPDPETDAPAFCRLAEEVIKEVEQQRQAQQQKQEQKQEPKHDGGKKWLWIGGGGAVAAGAIAVLLASKDETRGNGRLPNPPTPPPRL
jgi:tetratricopeptide (TPR) repeat protein